jgi:hypothetical protein
VRHSSGSTRMVAGVVDVLRRDAFWPLHPPCMSRILFSFVPNSRSSAGATGDRRRYVGSRLMCSGRGG